MADIEKVVKGLEHCAVRHKCNNKCPYSNIIQDQNEGMDSCVTQLSKDALELLKKQRAEIERLKEEKEKAVEKIKEDIIEYDKQAFDSVYFEGVANGMRYALENFTGNGGEKE